MRPRSLVFPVEDTAAINQAVDRRRVPDRSPSSPSLSLLLHLFSFRSPPSLPSGSVARRRPLTPFFAMCNDLKAPMVYEAIR